MYARAHKPSGPDEHETLGLGGVHIEGGPKITDPK